MAFDRNASPLPVLEVMAVTLGLGATGAWSMAASAWTRWHALSLGPICGEPRSALSLAGHCAACPVAVALTAAFAVTLLAIWRKNADGAGDPIVALDRAIHSGPSWARWQAVRW